MLVAVTLTRVPIVPVTAMPIVAVRSMPTTVVAIPQIDRRRRRADHSRGIRRSGGANRAMSSVNWRLVHRRTNSYGWNGDG